MRIYLMKNSRYYFVIIAAIPRIENDVQIKLFKKFRNDLFQFTLIGTIRNTVTMKLQIGEKLAIVGRNGSGKTTMIKLLCRLYDPDEGEILLNGVNIKKFRHEEYATLFSVIFPGLYSCQPEAFGKCRSKSYCGCG